MRVLICGDRNFVAKQAIMDVVKSLPVDSVVIEGEARGADTLARVCAEDCGLEVQKFPAQWNKYGRGAGPVRNRQMVTEGKPEAVFAFHDDIDSSKGTGDMVMVSKHVGLPVKVINSRGEVYRQFNVKE